MWGRVSKLSSLGVERSIKCAGYEVQPGALRDLVPMRYIGYNRQGNYGYWTAGPVAREVMAMQAGIVFFSVSLFSGCSPPVGQGDSTLPGDSAPADLDSGLTGCWDDTVGFTDDFPDYERFDPVIASHCLGTDHQDIDNIRKLVFLGDSITEGTPPSDSDEIYRYLVEQGIEERFGEDVEVADCAEWGARADDLLLEPHQQILECFPGVEEKRTLVVMTVGGNDMLAFGDDLVSGSSEAEVLADMMQSLEYLRDALAWFDDESLFPGGVQVIFGNTYEYTDTTGDLGSCPVAETFGFDYQVPEMNLAYKYWNEQYMQMATELSRDVIFMFERFCGHGFYAGDPDNACYRGEDAQEWFDVTCIHPNPTGHSKIAEAVLAVVDE